MVSENLILITHYCENTNTPEEFIYSLQEYGFIKIQRIDNNIYVESHEIVEIERISRLKNELGINLEGIDALYHMIKKISYLENELRNTKNRLKIYEP